jgi:hypothetical protein
MKAPTLAYRILTGLFVLLMLVNVYNYFFNPTLKVAFVHLGFPDWFRVELGIAKLLGALALGIPLVPARVKEWAYAGFFICFFSAIIAHHEAGDPVSNQVFPFIILLLLVASYLTFHRVTTQKLL